MAGRTLPRRLVHDHACTGMRTRRFHQGARGSWCPRVAVGHSEATAEQTAHAIDEGLTGVTHLYNAMPPMKGRKPGIVGTALADPRLTASIIADGLHVDPISTRAAFAAKRADGMALCDGCDADASGSTRPFSS